MNLINIFIGALAVVGTIFTFSLVLIYLDKKEKEWDELEKKEKIWKSKFKTSKEIVEILNRDKITNDGEKNN